jgi:predicted acyl esterase
MGVVSGSRGEPIETHGEMVIERDVAIEMSDGVALRADVFRPATEGLFPVLMSQGPYAKELSFQEGFTGMWNAMVEQFPEVAEGTSNEFQAFEVCDPEKWVPNGYAVVRIDSRGAGRSPGFIDCFGPQETDDFYECIEWAGVQPWSNGKVGLTGVSYYAVNQWQVAAKKPPHLAAICPWEGAADWYRDANNHGGIPSPFIGRWYPVQVEAVQHGLAERGKRSGQTGRLISGDEELPEDELAANRGDILAELHDHPLLDQYWRDRSADLSQIETPLLSSGNWGGQGLHLRGNIEGYLQAASKHKWLEIHGHPHWALYYTDYANGLQRRFFDRYLKGEGDWEETQPPVQLQVRHPGEYFERRAEQEWPLARTEWKRLYLDLGSLSLNEESGAESEATYQAFGEGVTLLTPPFEEETEITGPLAAKVWVSSTTEDTDLFLVLHLFDLDGAEVRFHGATEPKQSISQGWLRASHRKLDPDLSRPYQPVHPHLEREPMVPGEAYELEVEIWPTCIVAPVGYRLGLSILGRDWDHGEEGMPSHLEIELRGCGLNVHDDPATRPSDVYDGEVTVYGGGERPSSLLIPVIPRS